MTSGEIDVDLTAHARQLMPFAELLGLEIAHAGPDEVEARLQWRP